MKFFITALTTLLTLVLVSNSFALNAKKTIATSQSYFDVATGHRYIKNQDATYSEYTKKGELFRASVSPDLPLLTTNKYIREISQSCFMIYEKSDQRLLKTQILPSSSQHPKGWLAKNAIECIKNVPGKKSQVAAGLGYSSIKTSSYVTPGNVATGESYFDVATGHRYIKNSDATYSEFTKRGELFRVAVAPDLPLLTSNKNIREIGLNCYLLYEKKGDLKTETVVLPSDHQHPAGWSVENMLISTVR